MPSIRNLTEIEFARAFGLSRKSIASRVVVTRVYETALIASIEARGMSFWTKNRGKPTARQNMVKD